MHLIWHSRMGRRRNHLWKIFWWSVQGCRFLYGVENCPFPLTHPVAVNTAGATAQPVIHTAVGCHYFPPGLRLPSRPQSITAPWQVPNYTAWWQRHIGVNNLPKVITPLLPRVGFEPTSCWSQFQRSTRCATAPSVQSSTECELSLSRSVKPAVLRPWVS